MTVILPPLPLSLSSSHSTFSFSLSSLFLSPSLSLSLSHSVTSVVRGRHTTDEQGTKGSYQGTGRKQAQQEIKGQYSITMMECTCKANICDPLWEKGYFRTKV